MNGRVSLGKRIRHLTRYREITSILIRNGFGWFVDETGLARLLNFPRWVLRGAQVREAPTAYERIRIAVEQLGPTFIKMGQVASLRTDLLPMELTEELARLGDEVPPMPFETVRKIVEKELGNPVEETFSEFSQTVIGSASIGQVHRAVLISGETVAVKVQRQDIRTNIEIDFEILADIARLAEKRFDWAQHYALAEIVEEFRRTLLDECDYAIEARNAERIYHQFEDDDTVYIPKVNWDLSTSRILVMEYVEGIKLDGDIRRVGVGLDPTVLATRVCNAVFAQIFIHGFFHADPHPGNLAALPGNVILFMDFGMVGSLTSDLKTRLGSLIIGLMRRNTDMIVRSLYRMGVVPDDTDDVKLRRDVERLRQKYYDVPLSQVNIGESVQDIFTVAYLHRIRIPADLSMVGKALVTLEGVVEHVDPTFRIMDVAESFGRRMVREQMDPRNLVKEALGTGADAAEFLIDFPRQLRLLLRDARAGKTRVQLRTPELDNVLHKLDRVTNRITLSVMILSLSIFMAGLMIASSIARPKASFLHVPLTDVGLVAGLVMVAALVWSIIRSGRL